MAITLGTAVAANNSGGGDITWASFVVPPGATGLIVVGSRDGGNDETCTATWNTSESLTQIQETTTNRTVVAFYLENPTATTATLTLTGLFNGVGIAVPVFGSTGAPTDPQIISGAAATTDQVTVSSAVGDLVFSAVGANSNTAADLVAGGTEIATTEVGAGDSALGLAYESGASSVAADWSWSGSVSYGIVGWSLAAAGGGGSTPQPMYYTKNVLYFI